MCQENFKGDKGSFKGQSYKEDSRGCQVCFFEVSRAFPEYLKGVTRKFQEKIEGVSKKFHFACHSSQLPEQKEGLFFISSETLFEWLYLSHDSIFLGAPFMA